MNIFMISYDLNKPGQDYAELWKALEGFGAWCHYLDSTYLIKTSSNIYDVEKALSAYLDESDRMIICQIVKPIRGWLTNKEWEWINTNL